MVIKHNIKKMKMELKKKHGKNAQDQNRTKPFLKRTLIFFSILSISNEAGVWWVTTLLSYVGKQLLSTSFAVIWLYTAELLPTHSRLSGVGFCNFFGRIGAMVSPYIATLVSPLIGMAQAVGQHKAV